MESSESQISSRSRFPSRLIMDVVAAEVPEHSTDEVVVLDDGYVSTPSATAGDGDGDVDDTWDDAPSSSSRPPTAFLSLSGIARAERDMQRHVPLSSDGTHISLTRADIERIKDPDVLQFLEDNSKLFAKYISQKHSTQQFNGERQQHGKEGGEELEGELHAAAAAAGGDGVVATTGSPSSMMTIEAHIENLQKEIDTFITAVDGAGHNYRINLNDHGTLMVPVGDGDDEQEPYEDNGGDAEDEEDDDEEETPSPAAEGAANDEQEKTASVRQTPPAQDAGIEGEGHDAVVVSSSSATASPFPPRRRAAKPGTRAERFRRPVGNARRQQVALSNNKEEHQQLSIDATAALTGTTVPNSAALLTRQPTTKKKKKVQISAATLPPKIQPRPVRALLPDEEQRIEDLLLRDFKKDVGHNPFVYTTAEQTRLAEIEVALEKMKSVRKAGGDVEDTSSLAHPLPEWSGLMIPPHSSRSIGLASTITTTSTKDSKALGNTYMKQAREERVHAQKLHDVNAKLRRIHQDMEKLALAASADIPDDIRSMRPAWAREDPPPLVADDELLVMLNDAIEEQERAEACGLGSISSSADPFVHVLQNIEDVRARALKLVEEADAAPLELTAYASSDSAIFNDDDYDVDVSD